MWYVKNLPWWERVLRVVGGAVLVALALTQWPGPVGWAVAGACAVAVLTGLVGFCPMCAMVGRRPPRSSSN